MSSGAWLTLANFEPRELSEAQRDELFAGLVRALSDDEIETMVTVLAFTALDARPLFFDLKLGSNEDKH